MLVSWFVSFKREKNSLRVAGSTLIIKLSLRVFMF